MVFLISTDSTPRMSSNGRVAQQIRELQRQKRFNGGALPKNLLGGVEIPEDAFDNTDIPRRMALNASKKSDSDLHTAQNSVRNCTPKISLSSVLHIRRSRMTYKY